jgi:hypothetical protein
VEVSAAPEVCIDGSTLVITLPLPPPSPPTKYADESTSIDRSADDVR